MGNIMDPKAIPHVPEGAAVNESSAAGACGSLLWRGEKGRVIVKKSVFDQ